MCAHRSDVPRIVAETASFIVALKGPSMHCAPLARGEGGTLLDWCLGPYPEIADIRGRKPIEGGLLHRLDRDTAGLVLFARTQDAYDSLAAQQDSGLFVKEYLAECIPIGSASRLPGFPPVPQPLARFRAGLDQAGDGGSSPFTIESAFRHYGPGRAAVRPVLETLDGGRRKSALDKGAYYATEVLSRESAGGDGASGASIALRVRLRRGFRHQIRCHLAWIGLPLRGDALYGYTGDPRVGLGLFAGSLSFMDPMTGLPLSYAVPCRMAGSEAESAILHKGPA